MWLPVACFNSETIRGAIAVYGSENECAAEGKGHFEVSQK